MAHKRWGIYLGKELILGSKQEIIEIVGEGDTWFEVKKSFDSIIYGVRKNNSFNFM